MQDFVRGLLYKVPIVYINTFCEQMDGQARKVQISISKNSVHKLTINCEKKNRNIVLESVLFGRYGGLSAFVRPSTKKEFNKKIELSRPNYTGIIKAPDVNIT